MRLLLSAAACCCNQLQRCAAHLAPLDHRCRVEPALREVERPKGAQRADSARQRNRLLASEPAPLQLPCCAALRGHRRVWHDRCRPARSNVLAPRIQLSGRRANGRARHALFADLCAGRSVSAGCTELWQRRTLGDSLVFRRLSAQPEEALTAFERADRSRRTAPIRTRRSWRWRRVSVYALI